LYLLDAFNQVTAGAATPPPTSIYAPQVRYGLSGINPQVNLTGQVAVVATPAPNPSPSPVNPLSFKSGITTTAQSLQVISPLRSTK
jgi:hypothetical protein